MIKPKSNEIKMDQISDHFQFGITIPEATKKWFAECWWRYSKGEVDSIEEAFNLPKRNPRTSKAIRNELKLGKKVYHKVVQLHESDPIKWPLTFPTFEEVAKEFNVCKTFVTDNYYLYVKINDYP
jgi:hypothetical protein